MEKISITVTEEHAAMIKEAVGSGDYASTSEVVREALRDWRARRTLGRIWDEGIASGPADPQLSLDALKAEARKRSGRV